MKRLRVVIGLNLEYFITWIAVISPQSESDLDGGRGLVTVAQSVNQTSALRRTRRTWRLRS